MPVRHTPDPARVAYTMAGLLLLGMLMALPGALHAQWFLSLSINTVGASHGFFAMGLGVLFGIALWRRAGSRFGARGAYTTSGLLATAGLLLLSMVNESSALPGPLFIVGLAVGVLATGVACLISGALPATSARSVLHLAGVSFGAGAFVVCSLVWAVGTVVSWAVLVRVLAVGPLLLTTLALRAKVFRYLPLAASPWTQPTSHVPYPMAVLLGLALAALSMVQWTMGGWLAVYVLRQFGATLQAGLLILALFWVAFTVGQVVARRFSAIEERLRILFWCTAIGAAGCVFLLKTVDLSGAVMGAVLSGGSLGFLQPVALGIVARRVLTPHPQLLSGMMALLLASGFLGAGAVGLLAEPFAIEAVIWFSVAGLAAGCLLLSGVFVELKLTAPSTAVR
jgi:fucose permease